MKKKEKKLIWILVIVTLILVGILMFKIKTDTKKEKVIVNDDVSNVQEFVEVLQDGTKLNNSSKLNEMKKFEGLEIGNIQLTNNKEKTELIAVVKNETQKDVDSMLVDIILYDKNGNEIGTLGGYIGAIKAGKTMQFSTTAMRDYSNAYDFKIVKK